MVSPFVEVFDDDNTHTTTYFNVANPPPPETYHHHDISIDNLCLDWFSEGVRSGKKLQREADHDRLSHYKTRLHAQATKHEAELSAIRETYREEMDFWKAQVFALKDELVVAHDAYDRLTSGLADIASSGLHRLELLEARDPKLKLNGSAVNLPEGVVESARETSKDVAEIDLVDDLHESRSLVDFEDSSTSSTCCSTPESPPLDISTTHCYKSDDGQNVSEIASLISAAHEGDSIALQSIRTLIRAAEKTPRTQRSPAQRYLLVSWSNTAPPPPPPPATLPSSEAPEIFVDASGYGIGFIFNDRWLAWRFSKTAHPLLPLGPDGKLIMSWAELIAVEMGIRTLVAAGFRNTVITVRSDNQGVVVALTSEKWTQKYDLDGIVRRILRLSSRAGLSLKMKWISTKENPADGPSRGVYPPRELEFHCRPSISRTLSDLIQEVE